MSGNNKRLRLLLIIVIVELVAIIGLAIWGLTKSDSEEPGEDNTAVVEEMGPLTTKLIATGLKSPTTIVATPTENDNRLFVTERPGTIKIINKNGGEEPKTFLDITSKVKDNGSEMGLLGLAFHPDFADNGFFFVNYTDKDDNTIVARYEANAEGQADPATEKVLLTVKQPYENHNGGALMFGPDGFLYVALGDGGSGGDPGNRGQNKGELLGKILRIDVNKGDPYAIPPANPFTNEAGAKPEIWAWGLRNPWRISFDKQTGDLFIADVGQNKLEEVNVQKADSKGGENYGWRCYEGSQAFNTSGSCGNASQFVMPAFEYEHADERCSVAGGYVYRGTKNTALTGKYIFGDTCSGEIFAATQSSDGKWSQETIVKTPYYISTFGEDQDGELYIADLKSGSIYRLTN